jgi:large conductance mechanosensitive channel
MKFVQEFREFAMRGNVIDMAVGIIIGGAFQKIVTSLVNDVVMPPLGLLAEDQKNFGDLAITLKQQTASAAAITIRYGAFINTVIDFLIISLVIFLIIKQINFLRRRYEPGFGEATTKDCPYCCSKIPVKATRCPQCTSELAATTA